MYVHTLATCQHLFPCAHPRPHIHTHAHLLETAYAVDGDSRMSHFLRQQHFDWWKWNTFPILILTFVKVIPIHVQV